MNNATQIRLHNLYAALADAKACGEYDRADRIQLYIDELI